MTNLVAACNDGDAFDAYFRSGNGQNLREAKHIRVPP
jgi:hypothetical protein